VITLSTKRRTLTHDEVVEAIVEWLEKDPSNSIKYGPHLEIHSDDTKLRNAVVSLVEQI